MNSLQSRSRPLEDKDTCRRRKRRRKGRRRRKEEDQKRMKIRKRKRAATYLSLHLLKTGKTTRAINADSRGKREREDEHLVREKKEE